MITYFDMCRRADTRVQNCSLVLLEDHNPISAVFLLVGGIGNCNYKNIHTHWQARRQFTNFTMFFTIHILFINYNLLQLMEIRQFTFVICPVAVGSFSM